MRAFISYSSKDKVYADALYNALGDFLIIDYKSFEQGGKTLEEIINKLDQSDLYVLLLSRDSVQSDWVQKEIRLAKDRLDADTIRRIVPVNIDKGLRYDDVRIPEWIRKSSYSLHPISRPGKVALIITRHLQSLSDEIKSQGTNLSLRSKVFYNRTEEMRTLTERITDFNLNRPTAIVASGMSKVGRKTLLKHMLTTLNISLHSTKVFPEIVLEENEGIADMVLKIDNLDLTERLDLANIDLKDDASNARILNQQLLELAELNEAVLIEDRGSIVLRNGHVADWFLNATSTYYLAQRQKAKLLFCVASFHRPTRHLRDDSVFNVEVNDFARQDLIGLAKLVLENQHVVVGQAHLDYLMRALTGYPDQAYLAASHIVNHGLDYAIQNILTVQDIYVKDVVNLLQEETQDSRRLTLLLTLARYDLFSFQTLKEYLFDYSYEELFTLVSELEHKALINFFGASREFFALSKIIRDFISRRTYHLDSKYLSKAKEIAKSNALSPAPIGDDISMFYSSMRDAVVAGFNLNSQFVLPSHYIKAIEILYNVEKKYPEVIQVGDYVLKNNQNLNKLVVRDIKYYQCLSLARLRDKRCLEVVKHFDAYDYYFIVGYYYRKCGMYEDAIKHYRRALELSDTGRKARRELVLVYNRLEMYEDAYEMAKENYERDRNNAFYLQAYIESLIRVHPEQGALVLQLIEELDQNQFQFAKEMALIARADYQAHIKKDLDEALRIIGTAQTAGVHTDSTYVTYKEFRFADMKHDLWRMHQAYDRMKAIAESGRNKDTNLLMLMEARIAAGVGQKEKALGLIGKLYYPQSVKDKWIRNL